MHELYKIKGTKNICQREINGKEYNDPTYWPSFQSDYEKLKQNIINGYEKNIPLTFVRIFDGEFFFLQRKKVGNVGSRHCSKNLNQINIEKFRKGFIDSDYVFTQIYTDYLPIYHKLIPERPDVKPMEHIYSLIANKWLFNFKDIGLIGGTHKIDIIKKLMKFPEYQEYLGIDKFTDYISVPERYTCDNVDYLEKEIGKQLETCTSKIFLFGIGISKLALANTFKKYKNALFIDIGCGMSAMAGTTSLERPYFGGWTNFRLKNYNYAHIDQIDYKDTRGKNEIILEN